MTHCINFVNIYIYYIHIIKYHMIDFIFISVNYLKNKKLIYKVKSKYYIISS